MKLPGVFSHFETDSDQARKKPPKDLGRDHADILKGELL